ncbi:hypothetical protein OROGR_020747 [Orobanche gracilis]
MNDCVDATLPLLQVLRIAGGDERSALAEIAASIDYAKDEVKKKFGGRKIAIRNKLLKIIEDCWNGQMGKPLHRAALFLNPGKYFDLLEKDPTYASRIREDFNDVLEKMVKDRDTRNKISNSVDAYKNSRECFAREMAIEHRKIKSPLDWWDACGGCAHELQSFAKHIVGLCASSFGCERNWNTFEFGYDAREDCLITDLSQQKKVLRRRYYLFEKAKDANMIGILVGTLGAVGYLDMIHKMVELITKAGKKSYTLVMGRPNPAKLANFLDVMFLLMYLVHKQLLDSKEFLAPIITPFEAMLALGRGRHWTGSYIVEFRDLIAPAQLASEQSDEARFSFIQGRYVESSNLQEPCEGRLD